VVGGDAKLLLRVVSLFLQHGPAMCDAVFQAFTGGNAAALVAAVHKLKGALGDLSARCTFELCGRIEQLARQGNLPAARAEREKLEEQLGQVFQELKALEQELSISRSA
jgi:HPt (histidine-containing phosphotransfer) domain-containing protein